MIPMLVSAKYDRNFRLIDNKTERYTYLKMNRAKKKETAYEFLNIS